MRSFMLWAAHAENTEHPGQIMKLRIKVNSLRLRGIQKRLFPVQQLVLIQLPQQLLPRAQPEDSEPIARGAVPADAATLAV